MRLVVQLQRMPSIIPRESIKIIKADGSLEKSSVIFNVGALVIISLIEFFYIVFGRLNYHNDVIYINFTSVIISSSAVPSCDKTLIKADSSLSFELTRIPSAPHEFA